MWSFASSTRPPPNSLAHIPLKVTAPSPAGIAALGTAALQGLYVVHEVNDEKSKGLWFRRSRRLHG
jgi:hypothetical protein